MARIRSIKPEFWTDAKVGECSPSARLLFVACWTFSDDHGHLDRSAKQLKAQAFPYDQIDCEPLIQELLQHELLIEYQDGESKFLYINGFRKHQKIDKPAKPRLPLYDDSKRIRRVLGESSASPPQKAAADWKGLERRGEDQEGDARGRGSRTAKPDNLESRARALATPGLDLDAWMRWETYRREIKKPIKSPSLAAACEKLTRFGPDQAAVVAQSIAEGYQGLFELKPNGSAKAKREDKSGLPKWYPGVET
ncbi:hypothetical protein [Bradyrhizobium sp.]|uniref:hypothetical protein n=1 Tax=Bradyrhizobium sp. TaxID=376 RepID=UPI003C4D1FBD